MADSATSTTSGESLMDRVKYVLREGNIRHAVVTGKNGTRYVDLSLTIVIVFAVLAPWLAAIGVVLAVVTGCSLQVIRNDGSAAPDVPPDAPDIPEVMPPTELAEDTATSEAVPPSPPAEPNLETPRAD